MVRRDFVGTLGMAAASMAVGGGAAGSRQAARTTVEEWRKHFPALGQHVNGHPLVYLDTAATSLRPKQVIDAIADFYATDNANPGATLHTLARPANPRYEGARERIAVFLN